jgi:hypothetical protein
MTTKATMTETFADVPYGHKWAHDLDDFRSSDAWELLQPAGKEFVSDFQYELLARQVRE